jgi:hypothetical protein
MAINLSGLMAPLAAPPSPEVEFERTFYLPRQQELAQQLGQAKVAGLQQQMQQAAAMAPLQQQMEQQKLAQAQAMGPLQQAAAQQQMEQARAMGPLQQQLIQQQAALARTKSLFTPEQALNQALQAQQLKNQALLKAAQLKNQADSPFEKARAARMDKNLGTVNERAGEALEISLPLFNKILKAADAVPLGTGPLAGRVLWASPEGQYLKGLIVQNQANFIKTIKLGRMSQIEFNLLRKARGEETTFTSALKKLVKDQIEKAKLDIAKQHMYNTYISGGGRNPDEIAMHWSKQAPTITKQLELKLAEPTAPSPPPPTSMPKDIWIKLAMENAKKNPKYAGTTETQLSAYYDAHYGGRQ